MIIDCVLCDSSYRIEFTMVGCCIFDSYSLMLPAPLFSSSGSWMDCSFVELTIELVCCWLLLCVRGSTSATRPQLDVAASGAPAGTTTTVGLLAFG